MSKILFEITEEQLETGLRGYPCGYCTTSYVDATKGLFYVGSPIAELAYKSEEDVMGLLYFGHTPTEDEKKFFVAELQKRAVVSMPVIQAIQALPKQGHPMQMFSAAVLILGMVEGSGDYKEDCLNVLAKMPHLAAIVINTHAGFQETPMPRNDLGYMENFFSMLQIPQNKDKRLYDVLKLFNILHYDHGGGNLSTFVGKTVASGLEDMYGSLASSLCALSGPRHGRANQDCLLFVEKILHELGENVTQQQMEEFIRRRLDNGELIFGFGHAVLRVEDPRATVQYTYAQQHFASHPLIKVAQLLRQVGSGVLKERENISCPYPNVDAISGALLYAAGFSYPQYFTVLFGLSRCVGIAIQIVYERTEARGGKGTPIVRPKYIYKAR